MALGLMAKKNQIPAATRPKSRREYPWADRPSSKIELTWVPLHCQLNRANDPPMSAAPAKNWRQSLNNFGPGRMLVVVEESLRRLLGNECFLKWMRLRDGTKPLQGHHRLIPDCR
jgi:hypothetical protein